MYFLLSLIQYIVDLAKRTNLQAVLHQMNNVQVRQVGRFWALVEQGQ